jgi:hypothetical protein
LLFVVALSFQQVEGLPKEEADALLAGWAADREAALVTARRRLAAVLLLQRRLPVLMTRRYMS